MKKKLCSIIVLLVFWGLYLLTPCFANVTLPYDLQWESTSKECSNKLDSLGFQKEDLTENVDNPFFKSIKKDNKILKEYGFLKIRYKNQKKSPSTVIYLDFMDNKLWQIAVRYNFFEDIADGVIGNVREKTYHDLYSKYGKELDYQQVANEGDTFSYYLWNLDNTTIVYAHNDDEQPDPYLNITRVAYTDATAYKEVQMRNKQILKKYGPQITKMFSQAIIKNIIYYQGVYILFSLIPFLFVLVRSKRKWWIGIIASLLTLVIINLHLFFFDFLVVPIVIGVFARNIVVKQNKKNNNQ